ncbi:hypothetical protein V6N13_139932 [Hibiscus sabdariffa]
MGNANGCATMDIVDMSVSEPETRYGPWIQLAPRKTRRNVLRKEGTRVGDGTLSRVIEDNRFDVLSVEDDSAAAQGGGSVEVSSVSSVPKTHRPTSGLTGSNGKGNGGVSKLDKIRLGKVVIVTNGGTGGDRSVNVLLVKDVGQNSGSNEECQRGDKHGDSTGKVDRALEVASDGVVVSVPVTLNPSHNTAVRVLNRVELGERVVSLEENMAAYDELALMEQVTENRLTKVKWLVRKSPYPQWRATTVRTENKPPTKVHIGDWVDGVIKDLQAPKESSMRKSSNITDTHKTVDGEVHWRSNLAFARDRVFQ